METHAMTALSRCPVDATPLVLAVEPAVPMKFAGVWVTLRPSRITASCPRCGRVAYWPILADQLEEDATS